MSFYEDGDFDVATACGPKLPRYPFQSMGDKATLVYEQPFMQRLSKFKPLALGTRGDSGTYLVEESEPEHIGGGIGKWTRTYANVPRTHRTFESYVYTYQVFQGSLVTHENTADFGLDDETVTVFDLTEFPQPCAATLVHDFFFAPNNTANIIPLGVAPRIVRAGEGYAMLGSNGGAGVNFKNSEGVTHWANVPTSLSGMILAEDSKLERWMGDIYERVSVYVPVRRVA